MNRTFVCFMSLIGALSCFASTSNLQQQLNAVSLMTSQDLTNNQPSNLNLTNHTGQVITVYGLYLYGVAFITPGADCTVGSGDSHGVKPLGQNYSINESMVGGGATPVSFGIGQSIPIGQNYLYNMLYNYLYWRVAPNGLNSPAICALPGCSWSTDINTSPPNQYNWCFKLGALSLDASYTENTASPTSNVPPYAWPTTFQTDPDSPPIYTYDLIPSTYDYQWIGPFTCNDRTLTCSTPVPQYQSFQSAS